MSHRDESHAGHHVVPVPVYVAIFAALLVLTGLTVWVAFLDLGSFGYLHTPIALAIAGLKAGLVVLWFMHVKYSPRLTWIFIAAGMLWLVILIAITVSDYVGRNRDAGAAGWRAVELVRPLSADRA